MRIDSTGRRAATRPVFYSNDERGQLERYHDLGYISDYAYEDRLIELAKKEAEAEIDQQIEERLPKVIDEALDDVFKDFPKKININIKL